MAQPILDQAKARLAEIEAQTKALADEAAVLRRMIAAAEGSPAPVREVPVPTILPPGVVFPNRHPDPITPWIVGAPNHGGMCACPQCVPPVRCAIGGN